MLGAELQTVQFAENFDPSHRPLNVRLTIDIFQWAECEIRLRSSQIVKRATRGFGEHPDGVAAIKTQTPVHADSGTTGRRSNRAPLTCPRRMARRSACDPGRKH